MSHPNRLTGFHGVYPMVLAFFDERGTLSSRGLELQVEAAVRTGCQGVAILGLATEVNKLSLAERRAVVEIVARKLNRRLPLSVTIAENTVQGQTEFAQFACEHGADWILLQPPPCVDVDEEELIRFFGPTIDATPVPVGIQNAPMYLRIGLSNRSLKELHRRHPNLKLVKVEDDPLEIPPLIAETEGKMDVFVGRGGMEILDLLAAGSVGIIPGFESCDRLARVYAHWQRNELDLAWRAYEEAEAGIVFLERSINHYVTYSREIAARRLGISPVFHRLPRQITPLGLSIAERTAACLGPLPTG